MRGWRVQPRADFVEILPVQGDALPATGRNPAAWFGGRTIFPARCRHGGLADVDARERYPKVGAVQRSDAGAVSRRPGARIRGRLVLPFRLRLGHAS